MKIYRRPAWVALIVCFAMLAAPATAQIGPPTCSSNNGFAERHGNLEFVNFLNSWIEAHTVDKWLEERRGYWFKTTDWAKDL
jgi:hypothetical protein